jgi:stage III sporulation protein AB
LAFLGCLWLGVRKALGLTRRRRNLERCAQEMEELARGLGWNAPPLGELLTARGKKPSPLRPVYQHCLEGLSQPDRPGFAQLWGEGVEALPGFSQEDRQRLSGAGELLGQYHREAQVAGLNALAQDLRRQSVLAGEEERRLGRVYSVAGGAAGLVLALLLM